MIQEKYKKTIAEFREVYNELYYLGKDLSFWQKRWLKRKLWRALRAQIRAAAWKDAFQK